MKFGLAEIVGPVVGVFVRELEGVEDGAENSGEFGVGSAKPGFGLWSRGGSH
jgi:hypothetical protein